MSEHVRRQNTMAEKKDPIHHVQFVKSSKEVGQCPAPSMPEFAFIGRSNVGKSSLINMLCRRKDLAKTSSKPGKTRLINHFSVNDGWYLVDLPGYGYAQVSKSEKGSWPAMIQNYLMERQNLYNLFVLLDARLPPQPIDLDFIRKLGEAGIPFSLLFTKADKLRPAETDRNMKAMEEALLEDWESLPPLFLTSSKTGEGRETVLSYIVSILEKEAGGTGK